jgi:hypothetical protein
MSSPPSGETLSTILRHDAKVTSYKIALLRAINDTVLPFPTLQPGPGGVAVPLRLLAERWVAYYWPFVDAQHPILQGSRAPTAGSLRNDISFRPALAALCAAWEQSYPGLSRPSDGHLAVQEMRVPRRREHQPPEVRNRYDEALRQVAHALEMPIRYAGPGGTEWSVFPRPARASELAPQVARVPGTTNRERCLVVAADLWGTFAALSQWVEALCVHEWCLFTQGVDQPGGSRAGRGRVFEMLTEPVEDRRPLDWERRHIDQLLGQGVSFPCPWTGKLIKAGVEYDVDHLVPVSVYPLNELWNLVPGDRRFNQQVKKDRMPTPEGLARAEGRLAETYRHYLSCGPLAQALREDAELRFGGLPPDDGAFAAALAGSAVTLVGRVADMRNLGRFQSGDS